MLNVPIGWQMASLGNWGKVCAITCAYKYVALRMMKHNVAENKERRSRQRFCKTVCCLVLSVDLAELDCSVVY